MKLHLKLSLAFAVLSAATLVPAGAQQDTAHMPFMNPQLAPEERATDLVHLGQAAIVSGATAEFFIEQIFNFPTMTEAYRIAAFDVAKQRTAASAKSAHLAYATG